MPEMTPAEVCSVDDLASHSEAIEVIRTAINQAKRYGVRRLLTISGDQDWCYQQALYLKDQLLGNCLTIASSQKLSDQSVPANKAHKYLGQELNHVLFDGSEGIDCDALAAVSGALIPGSLLILLVPEWRRWAFRPDRDSLRWSERAEPIAAPHFVKHIKRCLSASEDVMIFRQGQGLTAKLLAPRAAWQGPNGEPTQQQERILQKLLTGEPNYYSLTASRGRGKSALAGMLIQRWQGRGKCLLTGPNNASVESVVRWSQGKALFVAPDLLLAQCQRKERDCVDWLIVDEAAAIPISLLYQLTNYFTRILFTTTVLGYEGTGRGFLLKFCPGLPKWEKLTLSTPIRFAENDPLETFIDRLLLLNDDDVDDVANVTVRQCHIISLSQQTLSDEPALLSRFYGLLTSAHYRTTPLDLRRLLDAPNALYFAALNEENHIISALWAVQEGGLSEPLAHEVWAGRRRPKGNLVAQSLSAHAGLYSAPVLSSIRISRIAVEAGYRRRGIARRAIAYLAALAADRGVDYLSVSFGYTESLAHFWRSCGLRIIHMGSQKEASSGCYAAMAILPFTDRGRALFDEGLTHFNRSQPQNDVVEARCLNESDWRELAGFAFGLRSLESAYASLGILVEIDINNYSIILNSYIKREKTMAQLIIEFNLSGKKAFINRCRDEVARLLFQTDNQKTAQLRQWVLN